MDMRHAAVSNKLSLTTLYHLVVFTDQLSELCPAVSVLIKAFPVVLCEAFFYHHMQCREMPIRFSTDGTPLLDQSRIPSDDFLPYHCNEFVKRRDMPELYIYYVPVLSEVKANSLLPLPRLSRHPTAIA